MTEDGRLERLRQMGIAQTIPNKRVPVKKGTPEFRQMHVELERNKTPEQKAEISVKISTAHLGVSKSDAHREALSRSTKAFHARTKPNSRSGHRGIHLALNGRFYVNIGGRGFGGFATLEEAIVVRENLLKDKN
jgi:hypothetical protein